MRELEEKLLESEQDLQKISEEIGSIENEMEMVMKEIMSLGVNTLGLKQELIESWDYVKTQDKSMPRGPNFDKNQLTKDNLTAFLG